MTKIETLQTTNSKKAHLERLLEGLNNEPHNYIWTGKVNDLGLPVGSCVCGHQIRYEYILEHKTTHKTAIVGSICVGTFQIFDKETTEAILAKAKEIQDELRKAKAEAKKNVQREEIQKLLAIRKPLLDIITKVKTLSYNLNKWLDRDLYTYTPVNEEKYVQLSACIKALEKDITALKSLVENHGYKVAELEAEIAEKEAKEKIEDDRKAKTEYIGVVGEIRDFTATVFDSWYNRNYDCTITKLSCGNAVLVVWGKDQLELGKTYTFNAEVKRHSEYRGEKGTTLKRVTNIVEVA